MTPKQKWLLVGVLALAIFFRYFQIMALPGGLFPDEAANGLDINSMQQGQLQPFYERGNGREALFFYMLWGSVEIFGKGPWQHHIVSSLVGVLAVLGCFLVTRQLFKLTSKDDPEKDDLGASTSRATNLALWAAFFMAVSSWHVVLSRTAFRANLIPLFTAFTFYFLLMAVGATTRGKKYLWSILTGATFALGFYSYIAYRIMVPLIIVAVLWPLAVDLIRAPRFQNVKKFFGPALAAGAAFIAFIAPLAHYFYTHPGSFVGRSGQVSIFNPDLNQGDLIGTFLDVLWASLKAYFMDGDLNWRHNVSDEPFLSIIISPFFLIGIAITMVLAVRYIFTPIKNKADWKYFLLAGWFWSMLIPVVTTAEGIPHGLRAIGTIPVVFIMAAVGLIAVVRISERVVNKYWPLLPNWKKTLLSFAFHLKTVVFIGALIAQAYILYFVYTANSPDNYYAFRSDLTPVSWYLNERSQPNSTYLVLDKFSIQTVDYLTSDFGKPYKQVDPEDSWKLAGLKSGDKIVFTQSSLFDVRKFRQYHPEVTLELEKINQFNQTIMAVYTVN